MIVDYSGVPIYQDIVPEILFNKIQDELEKAYSNCSFSMKEDWGPTHYLSDISFKENLIQKYNLVFLSNEIKRHLGIYLDGIKFHTSPCYRENMRKEIVSSWFSKFEKGCYAHIHNHSYHDIAGVYYFKTPINSSGIFFRHPIQQFHSSLPYKHLSSNISFDAKEGTLLLFPGWLEHGVMTSNIEETRVSVSFNFSFDRPELCH